MSLLALIVLLLFFVFGATTLGYLGIRVLERIRGKKVTPL